MNWLEQLMKALEGVDGGEDIIKGAQGEMSKKNKENESLRKRMKAAEQAQIALKDSLNKVLTALGVEEPEDGDELDLDGALEALQDKIANAGGNKGGGKGATAEVAELQKQLNQLKRNLDKLGKDKEASDKLSMDERTKRINLMRVNAVLAALTEGKAVKPQTLMSVVGQNVKINDEDKLVFVTAEGDEVPVAEGVKQWLTANPEFVVGSGTPGAGTAGGKGTQVDDAKKGTELAEARNKAQAPTSTGLNLWG